MPKRSSTVQEILRDSLLRMARSPDLSEAEVNSLNRFAMRLIAEFSVLKAEDETHSPVQLIVIATGKEGWGGLRFEHASSFRKLLASIIGIAIESASAESMRKVETPKGAAAYVPAARERVEMGGQPGLFLVMSVNREERTAILVPLDERENLQEDVPFYLIRSHQEQVAERASIFRRSGPTIRS